MDLEKLLPSAIPILLIIAFSWFLSYLGAKSKKKEPEAQVTQNKQGENLVEKKILEFFGVAEEVEKAKQSEQTPLQTANEASPSGWASPRPSGGAVLPTSKPIEPRWWGA
jgi:hypothetical protein